MQRKPAGAAVEGVATEAGVREREGRMRSWVIGIGILEVIRWGGSINGAMKLVKERNKE